MSLRDFPLLRWLWRLASVLIVTAIVGGCGAPWALETGGQLSVAPSTPAPANVAATISARLSATLPPTLALPPIVIPAPAVEPADLHPAPSILATATPTYVPPTETAATPTPPFEP